jgi:SlyX protein|tara:strand:+ start:9925 stop:10143 length:219 start_codon:yes stop_codon:yes gene_type:complete
VAKTSEQQIEQLQSQLAFQEDELEKMHDALYQQQQRMDAMDVQLKRLTEQYKTIADNQTDGAEPTEEKPPHY